MEFFLSLREKFFRFLYLLPRLPISPAQDLDFMDSFFHRTFVQEIITRSFSKIKYAYNKDDDEGDELEPK